MVHIKNQKTKLLVDRIKRISNELMNEYSERFGTDFVTNKQSLNEISIVRSKGLKTKLPVTSPKYFKDKQNSKHVNK